LTPVSWFIVAAPFVITSLATAISMGSHFDEVMFLYLQPIDTTEMFTTGTLEKFQQPYAPEAGGPPEPSYTVATGF
jgi:hypothetical protein